MVNSTVQCVIRSMLGLVALVACHWGCGGKAESDPSNSTGGGASCDELASSAEAEISSFVVGHRDCGSDVDCAVAFGPGWCACSCGCSLNGSSLSEASTLASQLCATFDSRGCPHSTETCAAYASNLCVAQYDNDVRCYYAFDPITVVNCTNDSQCGAGKVCHDDPRVPTQHLSPGEFVCASPCTTDLDCRPDHKCDSTGHCQARPCAECPSYFSCTSGTCVIPTCTADIDCSGGYCVNGSCAASRGVCQQCRPFPY